MAKITDPDFLTGSTSLANLGTDGNIWVDTTSLKIALSADGTSLLDDSFVDGGVSIQAVYSWLKEQWKTNNTYIKFPFPMVAITPEQFEFVDQWEPSASTTIPLFRDGGFAVASGGSNSKEYIGVITLGTLVSPTQTYYQQSSNSADTGYAAVNTVLTGAVNQCVKVYDVDGDDYRDYFKIFAREYQNTYGQADHTDIGVTTFTYQAYRFPLATGNDLKVTAADSASSGRSITVTYYDIGQARTIGTSTAYFDVIIDAGSSYTTEEIYEHIQWRLRQPTDIDDGADIVTGNTANLLLSFVGDTLVTENGVFVDNILDEDINAIDIYDTGGTLYQYPYVAAGTITFNDNLYNDTSSIYRMFFTGAGGYEQAGSDFGTTDAILVFSNDKVSAATDISYSGQANGNVISAITSTNFSTAGLTINNMVLVTGSTSNDGYYTITGVSSTALSVQESLTDEAAGDTTDLREVIGGNISGATSVSFSYDYDNNTQRGNSSSGTTAPITIVGIGLGTAQYVKTTGTITRTNANAFSLVAALERNYSNP